MEVPSKNDKHAFFRLGSREELHLIAGQAEPADDDIDVDLAGHRSSVQDWGLRFSGLCKSFRGPGGASGNLADFEEERPHGTAAPLRVSRGPGFRSTFFDRETSADHRRGGGCPPPPDLRRSFCGSRSSAGGCCAPRAGPGGPPPRSDPLPRNRGLPLGAARPDGTTPADGEFVS